VRNVSDKTCRESRGNLNSQVIFNTFFSKIILIMRYVEKYGTTGQDTDDNMAQADTQAYRHAPVLCNIIAFPLQ
jgi:hypothetical protein